MLRCQNPQPFLCIYFFERKKNRPCLVNGFSYIRVSPVACLQIVAKKARFTYETLAKLRFFILFFCYFDATKTLFYLFNEIIFASTAKSNANYSNETESKSF